MATKAPTSLAVNVALISSDTKVQFTFSWKNPVSYTKLQVNWRYKQNAKFVAWRTINISGNKTSVATSMSVNVNSKLNSVEVKVRGYKGSWSGWSSVVSKELYRPYNPSLSMSYDSSHTNITTFSWNVTDNTAFRSFIQCEWESALIKNGGATADYTNCTKGTATNPSYSRTFNEESELLADGSYTRWFRVRSRGPFNNLKNDGLNGNWRQSKHVYALPLPPVMVDATATKMSSGSTKIVASWQLQVDANHPIESSNLEYAIATPNANLECPSDASWTDVNKIKYVDSNGNKLSSGVASYGSVVGLDQCLFVRARATHDEDYNSSYSSAMLASGDGGKGNLTAPSGLQVNTATGSDVVSVTVTNNSAVTDSNLAILYRPGTNESIEPYIVSVIEGTGSKTANITIPGFADQESYAFGTYAFQGTYSLDSESGNYNVVANMSSETLWQGGTSSIIPIPLIKRCYQHPDYLDVVIVEWDWSWDDAAGVEITWSDNPEAWESTKQPSSFKVERLNNSKWNIMDMDLGVLYYFKIRFYNSDSIYTPWSKPVQILLSASASLPAVYLNDQVIAIDKTTTIGWTYEAAGGLTQVRAEICDCDISDNNFEYTFLHDEPEDWTNGYSNYYEYDSEADVYSSVQPDEGEAPTFVSDTYYKSNIIATVSTETNYTISPTDLNWEDNSTHYLAVRLVMSDNSESLWSNPISLGVADAISCEIESTNVSLVEETIVPEESDIPDDPGRTVLSLKELTDSNPFTITVTGGSDNTSTVVFVERFGSYLVDRPDETEFNGYDGETIVITDSVNGPNPTFEIRPKDLVGSFDDGGTYKIYAVMSDTFGQVASTTYPTNDDEGFEVHWSHQPEIPVASVEIDNERLAAKITVTEPEGYVEGDTFDIYRLTADKPELLIQNGIYGTTYVDPYPAFGIHGGHRIVNKTSNGDYITEDNEFAWLDLQQDAGDFIDYKRSVVDYEYGQIVLMFNLSLNNNWEKDFKRTVYLGGSVVGDWNPGVTRNLSLSTVFSLEHHQTEILQLRDLSRYPGICHIRTPDGSSFNADIQISEDRSYDSLVASFSLDIKMVDAEGLEGMTLADWNAYIGS